MKKTETPYVFPFALFITLSLVGQQFEPGIYIMYPIKTVAVAASLWYFRKSYTELKQKLSLLSTALAVVVGLIVFAIWILPEGYYPLLGDSEFNPYKFEKQPLVITLVVFRLIGAALVVPVFEELFWRSFVIRWIISSEFKQVPLGKFTWVSFGLTVVFFGIEHHHWLPGLFAGAIYNALLYKTKNLWPCIVAHSVTNLVLGFYVLYTRQWGFW
jgi:hypothetical protein